jgi:peptidoglycan hydrolase CwlO-like protein
MSKQEADARRDVTSEDLQIVDRAIADRENFQTNLYTLRRILGEIGKLDIGSVRRGIQAEQDRLDEVRKQADIAQQQLDKLQNDIASKQRELANVEATIQERNVVLNQLNEGYNNLRRMLEAA